MSTATFDELTQYRWSSDDRADCFAVENPATGEVITTVQGGGAHKRVMRRGDGGVHLVLSD
jgi:hypothetical protein